ncbi:MAG: BamA/TamA family outer membrane protein [Pseudomonadota bacterium]
MPAHVRATLVIEGLDDDARRNVLAYVTMDSLDCNVPAWQIKRRFQDIDKGVGRALRALGYYTPQIRKTLLFNEDCWQAVLDITPGEQARYEAISVSVNGPAQTDPELLAVTQARPSQGDVVHHGRYSEYKKRLLQTLSARGFLDYAVERAAVTVDEAGQKATLELLINSGERYRIGGVSVANEIYDAALLSRFVTLASDQYFDSVALARQQQALASSDLFSAASVIADYEHARDGVIDVSIELTAVPKLGYFAGVGVTSDRGPRVSGGYRNRRVNSRGHQFSADVQHSQVLSQVSARYRRPLANPLLEWQTYELLIEREDTQTSQSTAARLGVERTRALPKDWLLSYGVRLGRTEFIVSDVEDTATLLMPVVSANRRVADNQTNPRRGSATDINVRLASEDVLSSTSFVQLYARHKRVWPVGQRHRFSLRAEAGITWRDEISELPPEIRFFSGGDDSVRGYAFESLGPVDSGGVVIGGSRLLAISAEYEHAITSQFAIAAFIDAGNAFDGSFVQLKRGAGVGFVWRSPVGPLRLYVGQPVSESGSPRLHVRFGADL